MTNILLLTQQRGNRQLLGDRLSRFYQVSIGESEQDLEQPFDLAITDAPMLARLRRRLLDRKSADLPLYLPVLLITSRQDTATLPSEVWNVIDELLLAPIDPIELRARVEVLLRARKDTLDLKRHNDELELFIAELTGAFEVAEDETQLTEILLDRALKISGFDGGCVVMLEGGEARLASSRGDGWGRLVDAVDLANLNDQMARQYAGAADVVVPILVKGETVGATFLGGGVRDQEPSDERLLRSLSSQAGVFLHNLRQAHRLVEAAHVYHQLDLAETVQHQLLPDASDSIEGLETAASYQATNRVGGDYYDVIELGPRRVAAVIADVAGHSLSSGLVMTAARSALRVVLQRETRPAQVVEQLNQVLFPDSDQTGIFITMCLIVVDLEAMTASYANAGHCPPMVFRHGQGEPRCLEATGLPLGMFDDSQYSDELIPLCEQDVFVLYTDGITEARDDAGEFWGEEGLSEAVEKSPKDAGSVSRALVQGAVRHSNNKLTDDLTVLVLKITK